MCGLSARCWRGRAPPWCKQGLLIAEAPGCRAWALGHQEQCGAGLAALPHVSLSNQRSNPCPLHRWVGSYPLHHEGSPEPSFDQRKLLEKVSAQTRKYTERGRYALQETGKPALARGRRNSKLGRKPRPGDS